MKKKQTRCLAFVLLVVYLWISMAVKFRACGSPLGTQWLDLVSWIHRRRNRWQVHSTSVDPICSMYGLFTYKTGWFLGHMLVNIPCMEHMGTISDDHRNWGENTFFFHMCGSATAARASWSGFSWGQAEINAVPLKMLKAVACLRIWW